jgi:hypothetical protein
MLLQKLHIGKDIIGNITRRGEGEFRILHRYLFFNQFLNECYFAYLCKANM